MKFRNLIWVILIVSSIPIYGMDKPMWEYLASKKQALSLQVVGLINALKEGNITPNVLHTIETNIELKSTYDALHNLEEFGLNPAEIKLLYDLVMKLDYDKFKLVINLIKAIRNRIELSSNFKKLYDRARLSLGSTDIVGVETKLKNQFIGNLLREIINFIYSHVFFKQKIELDVFEKNYQLSDLLLLQDASNQLNQPFVDFVRGLQLGDWILVE